MSLLDHVREAHIRVDDYVNIVCRSAVSALAADSSGASRSTLAAGSCGLLVVPVSAVLALSSHTANSALTSRLAISSCQYQGDRSVSNCRNNQFHPLRSVSTICSIGPRGAHQTIRALVATGTGIVVIPPKRTAIVSVRRFWRIPLRHPGRNKGILRFRYGRRVISLNNPFTHGNPPNSKVHLSTQPVHVY